MFYQTEAKLQAWRALAILADRSERLIYVGRSTSQVREHYAGAFEELFDDEEKAQVQSIQLQCWNGAADRGHWVQKNNLAIPAPKTAAAGRAPRKILPFRRPEQVAEEQETTFEEAPKRLATTA